MIREIDLDESFWAIVDRAGKISSLTNSEIMRDLVIGLKSYMDYGDKVGVFEAPYVLEVPGRYKVLVYAITDYFMENKMIPPIRIEWDQSLAYMENKSKDINAVSRRNLRDMPLSKGKECQGKIAELVRSSIEEIIFGSMSTGTLQ